MYGFNFKTSIKEIDTIIHEERINKQGKKITHQANISSLPTGTFVLFHDLPHLIANKQLYLWSPFGYGEGIVLPADGKIIVLTPASVVNTLRAGYVPQMGINQ